MESQSFQDKASMHYLIDGHNLIPKLPGLSLRAIDDEQKLVEMLQEYCRRGRNQVEVYFDNAPLGQTGKRKFGTVATYFISQGRTADDAIRARLGKLGRSAGNWTVVSSDHQVQMDARAVHARSISSEKFAQEIRRIISSAAEAEKPAEVTLSAEEVTEWAEIFREGLQKPKQGS
jgi:predicted RNA-binding protein with PIN domain